MAFSPNVGTLVRTAALGTEYRGRSNGANKQGELSDEENSIGDDGGSGKGAASRNVGRESSGSSGAPNRSAEEPKVSGAPSRSAEVASRPVAPSVEAAAVRFSSPASSAPRSAGP